MALVWTVWFLIIFNGLIGVFSFREWVCNARAGRSYWLYATCFFLACIGIAGGIVLLL